MKVHHVDVTKPREDNVYSLIIIVCLIKPTDFHRLDKINRNCFDSIYITVWRKTFYHKRFLTTAFQSILSFGHSNLQSWKLTIEKLLRLIYEPVMMNNDCHIDISRGNVRLFEMWIVINIYSMLPNTIMVSSWCIKSTKNIYFASILSGINLF